MDIKKIQTPKKISPCPIQESIVEIRFDSDLPSEIILGVLYNSFKSDFPKPPENLPILELPRSVRENDQNLKYSPHYEFTNEDYILRIAPKALSVACNKEYKGWVSYSNFAKKIFCELDKLKIIKESQRIGLRYISFFENINILQKLQVQMNFFGNPATNAKNAIRSEFDWNGLICIIQISNDAILTTPNSIMGKKGSSIDLDIVKNNNIGASDFNNIIESLHEAEKQIFFNLLSKEFLETLNPEY